MLTNDGRDALSFTITKPLHARIVLRDPDTGTDILVVGDLMTANLDDVGRLLSPGETLTFEYPEAGIKVSCE